MSNFLTSEKTQCAKNYPIILEKSLSIECVIIMR